MKKIYTGIGSRETPEDVCLLMSRIGRKLAEEGWTLRSGHASGADLAFEQGADKKEIFIPWSGFNGAYPDNKSYFLGTPEGQELAAQFHPAWHRCSSAARLLHGRNSHQILGVELDNPSDMVICWTPNGKRGGGTGQALRIAEHFGVPIFDLAVNTIDELVEFLNHGVVPSVPHQD